MKAKSKKQIKNSLQEIDVLDKQFKKAVIDTFGETDGINFEKIEPQIINGQAHDTFHVYDEKDGAERKDFTLITVTYLNSKKNKPYRKIIKVI